MLLAIGIGNTSIKLGVFDGDKIAATWHIATDMRRMPDEYAITLSSLLEQGGVKKSEITEAAMWCTVPSLIPTFEEVLQKQFAITPLVVGAGIAEAWDDLYYLERACEVQRLALATGRPLKIVAPDVAQRTYAQMMGEGRESAALHLQSIKRVLDREQPEYRT